MDNDNDKTFQYQRTVPFLTYARNVLQRTFKERYQTINGVPWDDTPEQGEKFANKEGSKFFEGSGRSQKEWKLLKRGDSSTWDISLLGWAIRLAKFDKRRVTPRMKEENKKIEKITDCRNQIVHHSTYSMEESEFEKFYNIIKESLVFLGEKEEDILKLKKDTEDPYKLTKDAKAQYQEFYVQAKDAHNTKNFAKAIELLTEALKLPFLSNADRASIYISRSAAFYELKSAEYLKRACSDAKSAVELEEILVEAYCRKGIALHRMEKYAKAMDAFNSALAIEPANLMIKRYRDESVSKVCMQERYEHLDANYQPPSREQITEMAKSSFGFNIQQFIRFADNVRSAKDRVLSAEGEVIQAKLYLSGIGRKQSFERAVEHFAAAARKGNAEGMYNLGVLFNHGKGVEQDLAMALEWYKKAAACPVQESKLGTITAGVAEAEFAIGKHFMEGTGVRKDLFEATNWITRSAEHHYMEAQNTLGVMYAEGLGVPKDPVKARQYYLAAAHKGCARAMYNLGSTCEEEMEYETAIMWYKRAEKGGFTVASIKLNGLLETKAELKGQSPGEVINSTRCTNGAGEEWVQVLQKMQNLFADGNKRGSSPAKPTQDGSDMGFDLMILETYSSTSSVARKYLEAKMNLLKAEYLCMESDERASDSTIVGHLAKGFKLTDIFHIRMELQARLVTCCERVLSKNPDDQDACLALAALCGTKDLKWTSSFLANCVKKFPGNQQLRCLYGSILGFEQRYHHALEQFSKSRELDPSDYYQLYSMAVCYRLLGDDKAISLYLKYLAHAEPDERKVPEAHYSIATIYFGRREHEKAREYYRLGLDAESNMLPCFLPYDSSNKNILHLMLEEIPTTKNKNKNKNNKNNNDNDNNKNASISTRKPNERLTDPFRVQIFGRREKILRVKREILGSGVSTMLLSLQPPKKAPPPRSLENLKPIFLNQIDRRLDKVHENRILTGILIDYVNQLTAAHTIFEDDNGDVMLISFYNFDKNTDFRIGRRLSIISPYIRIAADGQTLIRVDYPSSVVFLNVDYKNICYFCGKPDTETKLMTCKRCNNAYYCSKKCQHQDWELLGHKFVCIEKIASHGHTSVISLALLLVIMWLLYY